MNRCLKILRAGPGVTLQDEGRIGQIDIGVSRGGAADRLALAEATALLGRTGEITTLEMMGIGGDFEATEDLRIALTGAPMQAVVDGKKLAWNASHMLPAGSRLSLGSTLSGTYGYLSIGGLCKAKKYLNAHSVHLAAGIGRPLEAGDRLEFENDTAGPVDMTLNVEARFSGGNIRLVESFHSHLFSRDERLRFEATEFRRDIRGNRMGVRLVSEGRGFQAENGRNIISDVIVPGDVQITGDGTPFVLMAECQTMGGYPRIGTVLPSDLPKVAQAAPETPLRFRFIDLQEAVDVERKAAGLRRDLARSVRPLVRDPSSIPDLLSYQLISGAVAGNEE